MTATSRFRVMGGTTPSRVRQEYHAVGPVPWAPPAPVVGEADVSYVGFYQQMWDVVHKPFSKSSDPSQWQASPATTYITDSKPSSGTCTSYSVPSSAGRGLESNWSGDQIGLMFGAHAPTPNSFYWVNYPDLVNVDNLKQVAIVKCLNRINAPKSQALVTLAEMNKTVALVLDRAKKLAVTITYCRKGNLKALEQLYPGLRTKKYPKRVVLWDEHGRPILKRNGKTDNRYAHSRLTDKRISEMDSADRLWLEYRFGWTPAVNDIIDSLKAFYAQSLRDELTPKTYEHVYERVEGVSQKLANISRLNYAGGNYYGKTDTTHEVSVRAYAKYRVNKEAGLMNRLNDFGIFDVPRYVWEVTPYSFLIDRLIPIGDWLGAIQPKFGVEVLDSGVTVIESKNTIRTLTGYTPASTGVGSWPTARFNIGAFDTHFTKKIVRTIGLPVPFIPPFDVQLSTKTLLDVVALFRGLRSETLRI